MDMKSKTLIYCKQGAIESTETVDVVLEKISQTIPQPIKVFINKNNEETGRLDKYICDCFVFDISHIVDLRGKKVQEKKEDVKKLEEIVDNKNKEEK